MKRIRRTRQVRNDIIGIYQYIWRRNPQAAERVLDAIQRTLESLLVTPGVGRRWDSLDPRLEGMRVAVVSRYHNHLVFFRQTPGGIEAFRVVHGARELENIVEAIELEFDE